MVHLAIDIGNTTAKIGYFEGNVLLEVKRSGSLDELVSNILEVRNNPIIIASVAHTDQVVSSLFSQFSNKVILTKDTPLPIKNKYGTPQSLGYDRLAAAVGANGRFPDQNCLIVDIGTAIKYDLVSEENAFIGGVISAGREMRFKALHTFTKKLPLLNATDIPELVGTSTETCIESGVLNGILAEINGMIESYVESYNPVVLLCGGDAPYFETQIKYPTFATPNLVLEGLNRILLYNVAKA